jgi:hypothetical protein
MEGVMAGDGQYLGTIINPADCELIQQIAK